jgi:DNA-binding transcriptional LysR family regulator
MHKTNLSRVDINLLVVFDAVARTRSVTAAAGALALSQPAVSHALRRLRDLVGDPLFVRGRDGLVLTPRADGMARPVREILDAVDRVLSADQFNPSTARNRFRVAASDYSMITLGPTFIAAMRRLAPLATLELQHAGPETLARLEAGDLDVSFWGAEPPTGPFQSRELFRERYAGLVCAHHPIAERAARGGVTLDDYLGYPHVVASFRDPRPSPIDAALADIGRTRTIGVASANFAANAACLRGSDLIASLPSRLVSCVNTDALVSFALPLSVPDYPYSIVWHSRSNGDPATVWLRNLIADGAAFSKNAPPD